MPEQKSYGLTKEQEEAIIDLEFARDKCRELGIRVSIIFYGVDHTEKKG